MEGSGSPKSPMLAKGRKLPPDVPERMEVEEGRGSGLVRGLGLRVEGLGSFLFFRRVWGVTALRGVFSPKPSTLNPKLETPRAEP